jgi:hypothetical protein
MLADTQIITAATSTLQVTSQRFEIMFKDGTALGLHRVWQNGAPVTLLRALRQGSMLIVFDLAKIVPALGEELPKCPERDVSGLVFYTLRQRFKTARDCIEAVVANQKATLSDQAANQAEAEAA